MALELRDTDTEPLCKVTMGKRERGMAHPSNIVSMSCKQKKKS